MAVINQTYGEAIQQASSSFSIEKRLVERLLCDRLNWNKTDFVINYNNIISRDVYNQFQMDLQRLKQEEPVQYIVGFEWFYGRCFKVNHSTLIPRPETELLVEEVLKYKYQIKNLLDIGTGTGAIAITLKKECEHINVTASDISKEALVVARENSKNLNAKVTLLHSDLFKNITEKYDCIVSNPPYISRQEMSLMDASVVKYEPHLALFAENDGLAIYEQLAKQSQKYLTENGIICLEIGFNQGECVKNMFRQYFPNKTIEIIKDYANLDRIVVVK